MSGRYDLIVVGTGNAGQSAAGVARQAGLRVAIVEGRDVGGTCALRGCVPKKVLAAAGEAMDVIRRAGTHAITVGPATLDWTRLIARERTFVDGVPADVKADLLKQGMDVIEGRARFVGRDALAVTGQDQPLYADKFVVACGSVPRTLTFPGGDNLLTSDDLLELRQLPPSVAFVGAGVIAFELGHVMARAGARVTLLEMGPRALPNLDADAVARLVEATIARGIDIQVNVKVEAVAVEGKGGGAPAGGPRVVRYTQGDRAQALRVDAVAHGAGRVPAYEGLDLGAAGVTFEQGRPRLDEAHRSVDNPAFWFAGDAVPGAPQLSALATYEGRLVGRNIVRNETRAPDYSSIPSTVFAVPALASVGPTEQQARARGLSFEAKVNDMRTWRSARTHAEEVAWAKVLIDRAADRIVGAHLVGHGAAETINAFALAIRHGISATELKEGVFSYPTFHSDLKFLL
jgi:glutathione reductase (NADPH)